MEKLGQIKELNIDINFFTKYVVNFIHNSSNEEDKKDISPLKVQNFLYFLHVYSLTMWNKKLWNDNFEKWSIGPVVPEAYYEYSKNGVEIIEDENYFFKIPKITNFEKLHLEALIFDLHEEFSNLERKKLVYDYVWQNTITNAKIDDKDIIKYYSENETFFDKLLYDPSLESPVKFLS